MRYTRYITSGFFVPQGPPGRPPRPLWIQWHWNPKITWTALQIIRGLIKCRCWSYGTQTSPLNPWDPVGLPLDPQGPRIQLADLSSPAGHVPEWVSRLQGGEHWARPCSSTSASPPSSPTLGALLASGLDLVFSSLCRSLCNKAQRSPPVKYVEISFTWVYLNRRCYLDWYELTSILCWNVFHFGIFEKALLDNYFKN